MTDITDEQIKQWATEAELASWKPRMNGEDLYPRHPTLEKFRCFAELARQDERQRILEEVRREKRENA